MVMVPWRKCVLGRHVILHFYSMRPQVSCLLLKNFVTNVHVVWWYLSCTLCTCWLCVFSKIEGERRYSNWCMSLWTGRDWTLCVFSYRQTVCMESILLLFELFERWNCVFLTEVSIIKIWVVNYLMHLKRK